MNGYDIFMILAAIGVTRTISFNKNACKAILEGLIIGAYLTYRLIEKGVI